MAQARKKAKAKAKAKPGPKAAKKKAAKPSVRAVAAQREDFGKPIAGFLAKQPPTLLAILKELGAMIEEAAPDATASIKWGNAFYSLGDGMLCATTAHKSHVNLVLPGPPGTYSDPEGLLEGEGKTGKHLKLTSLSGLPRAAVRGWLRTAVELARGK